MKKIIVLMAFAALGTITMFSCKKNDNNASSTGSMTAIVNGSLFAASRCSYTTDDTDLAIIASNYSGTTPLYPVFNLTIYNYHGAGTYTLNQTLANGNPTSVANIDSTNVLSTSLSNTVSTYGTIDITSTSPNITGTFSFTTEDSTKVNGGTFTAIALVL